MKRITAIMAISAAFAVFAACTRTEKTYFPDGSIQSQIQYRGKKEHGKSIYYFNRPNTVEIEVEMRNGKRDGEFRRYFINGLLDTHCTFKNDSIDGIETMYLANGTKSQETTYVNGKKHGPHTAYHIDGGVKIEGNFKNGNIDGIWNYYDERGVLVGQGKFNNGTGEVSSYYPTGQLERTTHYANNRVDGKETLYDKSGRIYKEVVYKADRIVSEKVDSTLIP